MPTPVLGAGNTAVNKIGRSSMGTVVLKKNVDLVLA